MSPDGDTSPPAVTSSRLLPTSSVLFFPCPGEINLWYANCYHLLVQIGFDLTEGEWEDMRGREIEIFAAVQRWVREEEGQSVVEYSLLLTMLAATFVLVATMMGVNVIRLMQHSSTMTIDSTPVSRWRFDQP